MSDQDHAGDADEETGMAGSGSGNPDHDRSFLQDQPPAKVDPTTRESESEEDEDSLDHDDESSIEGSA